MVGYKMEIESFIRLTVPSVVVLLSGELETVPFIIEVGPIRKCDLNINIGHSSPHSLLGKNENSIRQPFVFQIEDFDNESDNSHLSAVRVSEACGLLLLFVSFAKFVVLSTTPHNFAGSTTTCFTRRRFHV